MQRLSRATKKLACDKDGKLVVFQKPNLPLVGWLICTALRVLLPLGSLAGVVSFLGAACLFTWAYLELTDGTTYLRRALGLVVIIGLIYSRLAK